MPPDRPVAEREIMTREITLAEQEAALAIERLRELARAGRSTKEVSEFKGGMGGHEALTLEGREVVQYNPRTTQTLKWEALARHLMAELGLDDSSPDVAPFRTERTTGTLKIDRVALEEAAGITTALQELDA